MELSLIKTKKSDFLLKKSINLKKYDKYIFLGKNPLLGYEIESILKNKIDSISYTKDLVEIQYEFRDDYIDFIDNNERLDFDKNWWNTRLSGKNPWISFTYFRFCQVLLIKKILNDYVNKNIKLLLIFEEQCVLNSVDEYVSSNFNLKVEKFNYKDHSKISLVLRGLRRRTLAIPFYLSKILLLKLIFRNFKKEKFFSNNIFVFSFLDDRCYRNKEFNDPFLGKFLDKIKISKNISYIPVLNDISVQKLKIFRKWISKNNHSVTFLPFYLKLGDLVIKNFNIKFPKKSKNKFFLGINLSFLIDKERLEEWADFNLQNSFIKNLSILIKNSPQNKLIIYPFENQIWERNMLSILATDIKSKTFGVQNAPAPRLSIRFFVSKKMVKHLPLPDRLFVTGNISYDNFSEFYNKRILRKISSSRQILKNTLINNSIENNIMVACSISETEAMALIIFICNSIGHNNNYNITILPHPLSKFNYSNFLNKIQAPKHFKIDTDYKYNLENSKYIIFDSSTAGIEGLLNNIIPIRVANKYVLNVNPSEYDSVYTKNAYNYDDLKSIINNSVKLDKISEQVALKYYELDDSLEFGKTIKELKFLNNVN